jgi:DNA-directed RNA polymerase
MPCAGIAFAGVHDSFWTHPSDVPKLRQLLRATFVQLHSQPLLEQLLEELREQHPNVEFPPIPEKGELDINCVLDSEYFFS